jgi:hypothetical protein
MRPRHQPKARVEKILGDKKLKIFHWGLFKFEAENKQNGSRQVFAKRTRVRKA